MIIRIHISCEESDLYETNEFYRNSVNRVAVDMLTRHSISVDIACLKYSKILATFAPLPAKVPVPPVPYTTRESQMPPTRAIPDSKKTLAGSAPTLVDLEQVERYRHHPRGITPRRAERSDTLPSMQSVRDTDTDPPPSFEPEKVELAKIKLKKLTHTKLKK